MAGTGKCKIHPTEEACFRCNSCSVNICKVCSEARHKSHNSTRILEINERKTYDAFTNNIRELEKEVENHTGSVQRKVQNAREDILSQLEKIRTTKSAGFNAMLRVINGTDSEVKKAETIGKMRRDDKLTKERSGTLRFVHSDHYIMYLPSAIGRLEWVSDQQEITEMCSFKTKSGETIRTICPVDPYKAWILSSKDTKIQLLDCYGTVIEEQDLGESVDDFCLLSSDIIVFTQWGGGTDLKVKLKNRTSITSLHTFDRIYAPGGVCRDDKSILVCLCSKDAERSSRVARLSIEGDLAKEVACYSKVQYSRPGRVAILPGNRMAVVDWRDPDRRVVVTDKDGQLLSSWEGDMKSSQADPCQSDDNAYCNVEPFQPFDVAYCNINDTKRLVVTDDSSTIYGLNIDGGDPTCIYSRPNTKFNGAIAVDPDGKLWIGDSDGCVHVMKAIQ